VGQTQTAVGSVMILVGASLSADQFLFPPDRTAAVFFSGYFPMADPADLAL
jgi:hypothetical protein